MVSDGTDADQALTWAVGVSRRKAERPENDEVAKRRGDVQGERTT